MRTRSFIADPQAYSIELATYTPSMVKDWSAMYNAWCSPHRGVIIDDGNSKRRGFKQVDHVKWTAKASTNKVIVQKPGYTWYGTVCPLIDLTWQAFAFPPVPDVGAYGAHSALNSCPDAFTGHYDRWLKVKPTMATRSSMTVFLAELRDIKRMFSLLPKRHLKGIRSWSDVRDLLRYTNDLHLNYNFGWKPFLSDIVNVRKAYQTYEQRLNKFMSRANSEIRQRVRDSGNVDTVEELRGPIDVRKTVKGSYTLSSHFAYSYEVPYSESELRIRSWLDSVGLSYSPATFWALLPWSFVVDFVVDVGGSLEQYSSDWSEPYIRWIMAGTSVKFTAEFSIDTSHPYYYTSPTYKPAVTGTISAYKRRIGYPAFSLGLQDLNADKIRLMSSLLAARTL